MANTDSPRNERIRKIWGQHAFRRLLITGELAHAHPSFGPNTYPDVGLAILLQDLKVPTGDYAASLVHSAYCDPEVSNEPEFKNVTDVIKREGLWVYNVNNWNEDGVYVIKDLKAKGIGLKLQIAELEQMVLKENGAKEIQGLKFSEDGVVRFAPKGTYSFGEHTPESLAKDGWVIISCDFRGAEQLGEVSAKTGKNPITYGIEVKKGKPPKLGVSNLCEYKGSLYIDGSHGGGNYGRGCAFGVFNS